MFPVSILHIWISGFASVDKNINAALSISSPPSILAYIISIFHANQNVENLIKKDLYQAFQPDTSPIPDTKLTGFI
jgi:hypothetical protein